MSESPDPLPTSVFGRFIRGLSYPFEGFAFIRRHRLWGLAAVSIGVNVALFSALLGLLWWVVTPVVGGWNASLAAWADGFDFDAVAWFATGVVWLIWILLTAFVLGFSSIILLLIGQTVASPFLDMLSEKVENLVLGTPEQPFSLSLVVRSVLLSIGDLFWGLVILALVHIPIFLVGLIPAVGTVPAGIASFAFSALLLSVEFLGLSLTRRFVNYRDRWGIVLANKWLSLGFGVSSMLLLLVPGLNLILLPLAAVGGTLAYCDLAAEGSIEVETSLAA